MTRLSGRRLTALVCIAQVLTMLGFSTYPVLLGPLRDAWALTNTEAGWIGGSFFAGYTVAVPVLVTLTDKIDPRRIWLVGALLAILGNAGFAAFADGLGSALFLQALAGAGLAGTYMPGLRLLADRLSGSAQSRAVSFYTASFGIGTASSYLLADWIVGNFAWRLAFAVPAAATALAIVLMLLFVSGSKPARKEGAPAGLLDLRPVLRNRNSMAYSLAYFAHSFELYTIRAWIIAFLTFSGGGIVEGLFGPAKVAFAMAVVGIVSILLGGECSIRFGRKRTVSALMSLSAITGIVLGISQEFYPLVVAVALLYGMFLTSESASVTAGALGNADPQFRGATIAVHSMIGFAGGIFGPPVFGAVLDIAGGAASPEAWLTAFIILGAVTLTGPAWMVLFRPKELAGDGNHERPVPGGAGR